MAMQQASATVAPTREIPVRTITTRDLDQSLKLGYRDFLAKRGDILFAGLLYPVIGLVAAAVSLGGNLVPLFFPLAAGLSLLGPITALGFYELARRREQGLESGWSHFLDVAKRPSWESILVVCAVLILIFAAWLAVAWALWAAFLGFEPLTVREFLARLFTTPNGWALIVLGNLAGLGFAIAVLALSVVSLPMLVDRDMDARTAMATSIRAVAANRGVMTRWGLIVAALLVLGSVPLFIGLAFVLPWLGYATWHLYTRLIDRAAG
jgi:uncharacterized membrane protein